MRVDQHVLTKYQLVPAQVKNWAPYCTELLQLGMDVEFPEGTFILGDSEPPVAGDLYAAYPSNRRSIVWGWGPSRQTPVRISGAGIGKTILKVANKLLHGLNPEHTAHRMLLSRGEGEGDKFDCPVIVTGITFDGNHRSNGVYTVDAMRVIGAGTIVRECEFVDFAPGGFRNEVGKAMHTPECFVIAAGLPSGAAQNSKGPEVIGCRFRIPGDKSISPGKYTTENTSIAIGGNMPESIMARGVRVEGCHFEGHFDRVMQQAPLHAITISSCTGARIVGNTFKDYEGFCIYTDSGQQFGTVIEGNTATNVWGFIQYTAQNWVRSGSSAWQITRFDDILIKGNTVSLSNEPTTYAWDAPNGKSTFLGYLYDRDLDPSLYPGFVNVVIVDNKVTIPPDSTFVANYGGYKDGGWKAGTVVGDVGGILVKTNQVNAAEPTPEVKEELANVKKEIQIVQQTLDPGKGGSNVPVIIIVLGAALLNIL